MMSNKRGATPSMELFTDSWVSFAHHHPEMQFSDWMKVFAVLFATTCTVAGRSLHQVRNDCEIFNDAVQELHRITLDKLSTNQTMQ